LLIGSSGDSGCGSSEDGGKLEVCAVISSGVVCVCVVMERLRLLGQFFACFIRELPGCVCVDFRNCGTVLIRGQSCRCCTILALISLPVPII
jgi:hypothetical protein